MQRQRLDPFMLFLGGLAFIAAHALRARPIRDLVRERPLTVRAEHKAVVPSAGEPVCEEPGPEHSGDRHRPGACPGLRGDLALACVP